MKRLIWQVSSLYPSGKELIKNYGFKINLDWDFAKKMIESKISPTKINELNELGKYKFDLPISKPFQFYKESGLLNMIDLGIKGKWLNTNLVELKYKLENKENLKYATHKIDNIGEVSNLIELFDLWVSFSNAFIE